MHRVAFPMRIYRDTFRAEKRSSQASSSPLGGKTVFKTGHGNRKKEKLWMWK